MPAAASPTFLPGPDGECGWQHGNVSCLPMEEKSCCSFDGFCGYNETYCLVSNGCQSDCVDPSVFSTSSLAAPTVTLSMNVTTTITTTSAPTSQHTTATQRSTITSASHFPTSTAAHHSGLTGGARTGVIAGGTVGGLALIALLIACIVFFRRRNRLRRLEKLGQSSPAEGVELRDATGFYDGIYGHGRVRETEDVGRGGERERT